MGGGVKRRGSVFYAFFFVAGVVYADYLISHRHFLVYPRYIRLIYCVGGFCVPDWLAAWGRDGVFSWSEFEQQLDTFFFR